MESKPIKIIIMGYHNDACKVADMILRNAKYEIVSIILPGNRSHEQLKTLINIAENNNIPYFIPKTFDKSMKNRLSELRADVIFSISYMKIIPKEIFNLPKYGLINLHESLLPMYRGSNPLNWVLINGETQTGVTAHYVTDELDAGDIVMQERISVNPDDDVVSLERKTSNATVKIVGAILKKMLNKEKIDKRSQNNATATFYPPRKPEDGEISFTWDSKKIHNYIRGLTYPWPGAYIETKKGKIIFWKSEIIDRKNPDNEGEKIVGSVLEVDENGVFIKTRDGVIKILSSQLWDGDYREESLRNIFETGDRLP